MTALISPIARVPVSESLYRQLQERITSGAWKAGQRLPSERALSEESGVNRNGVREAIKRLQQAGLVAVQQGGNHEVLDLRREAGLELLPSLVVDARGRFQPAVVAGLMSMRSVIAPEIAAEAALHGGAALADELEALLARMELDRKRPRLLQEHALTFWQALVDQCDNIAYQLAFNTFRKTYLKAWDRLTVTMAAEFGDLLNLRAIASAVRSAQADAARAAARRHVELGRAGLTAALRT